MPRSDFVRRHEAAFRDFHIFLVGALKVEEEEGRRRQRKKEEDDAGNNSIQKGEEQDAVQKEYVEFGEGLFVCWLVAKRPSNMRVYLRDGSAQTIVRAATLR